MTGAGYTEYPRRYTSTAVIVIVFAALFALDAAVNRPHLLGFALATAVVAGVDALVVRAARQLHTITVSGCPGP